MSEKRLGRGLELLVGKPEEEAKSDGKFIEIDIDLINPNPNQPRSDFDETSMQTLAESIKKEGMLQPIVVRKNGGYGYEIIAGERRLRAAKLAGLRKIYAIVCEVDEQKSLILALLENLQRKDLNPIEKGYAFKELLEKFSFTQEKIAGETGLARPTVANLIRLLDLPIEVKEAVSRGTISAGHARALLSLEDHSQQLSLLKRIIEEDLSVRALESLIEGGKKRKQSTQPSKDPNIKDLEERLSTALGTNVTIVCKKDGGRIIIDYYSTDQFNTILRKLAVI